MRILDCNSCQKKTIFPFYNCAWKEEDLNYFKKLQEILRENCFTYQHNHYLVRGLDYYTGLVFEVDLNQEKSLLGGGRYDRLFLKIGNINLPAIGFALGIDRLVNYLEKYEISENNANDSHLDIFFFFRDFSIYQKFFLWKKKLENKFLIENNLENKNIKLDKIANYYQPKLLIIIDKKEQIVLKDWKKKKEFFIEKENLVEKIIEYFEKFYK